MAYRDWGGAVADRAGENVWTAPAAASSIVPAAVRGLRQVQAPPLVPRFSSCPELHCVRHLLPHRVLALAEQRSAEIGVGADRVLVAWGFISEETYVTALSASLGIPFEPLNLQPRDWRPPPAASLIQAANTGMLPLTERDELKIVVVPRLVESRDLVRLAMLGADPVRRIRLTTTARLQTFVARHTAPDIEHTAVDELRERRPDLSAGISRSRRTTITASVLLAGLATIVIPDIFLTACEFVLGLVFLACAALRFLGLLSELFIKQHRQNTPEDRLPTYSIAIALYREAAAVKELIAALDAINYPIEKLDIKLVVEPDDDETRDAIARLQLRPQFEVIVAPARGPRTKPKALNAALPFARGKFIAVFDAEDRPEPDQLRRALDAFVAADEGLACVQARLTIDNTEDSWLTRLFTAEYAGLFDVFLPGLATWRLPLPLGGSSNHFRAHVLRKVGAWDPYNVTEDADLGMRLARFGYRTAVIASTTYEEAPSRLGPWLRQRTRWFKGWAQTFLVHTRSPARLVRELGWPGFAVFQLLAGGTVLAALVHGAFAARLGWRLATAPPGDSMAALWLCLDAKMLLFGYAVFAALGIKGLARRNLLGCAWVLLLTPLYWLLLSLAAWRAVFQLVRNPYHWEKTEHGLARTSRLAKRDQR